MARYDSNLEACTQDHRDKNTGESSSPQSQRPATTTTSTKKSTRLEELKTNKGLQPTTDTDLHGSPTRSHVKTRSNGQQLQKSRRQIGQHGVGSSSNKRSTNSSTRGARPSRLSRYGRFLTAPKPSGGHPAPRLPRCVWSLLSMPLTPPNVPIVAVTNPQGVVKYPFDHNYYDSTDSEDSVSSSSDGWESMDTSDMED
ncbi:uncharacterized protein F4807DRAFT_406454 [Annulohypoxylon truncatum]|uniref:uncharacterized protein n=1 Tax=Annulohypoxylon truncatum TaxID=327061 RepID=UPI0020076ADB|nr:uncharacterized protein F4807DRAFT_406454 [Annulohypoxylon truncatum]KAI1214045.1 hypothetical protein F4807DRAFT_406454 [Annulohypoxylon truncatum]